MDAFSAGTSLWIGLSLSMAISPLHGSIRYDLLEEECQKKLADKVKGKDELVYFNRGS